LQCSFLYLFKTTIKPTENITKFTKEGVSREGAPNQFSTFITSDDGRDTARETNVNHDGPCNEAGKQVYIDQVIASSLQF